MVNNKNDLIREVEKVKRYVETTNPNDVDLPFVAEAFGNVLEWMQTEKKMIEGVTGDYFCPTCDASLNPIDSFCWMCGQAVTVK